jgi:hypothetical protein
VSRPRPDCKADDELLAVMSAQTINSTAQNEVLYQALRVRRKLIWGRACTSSRRDSGVLSSPSALRFGNNACIESKTVERKSI